MKKNSVFVALMLLLVSALGCSVFQTPALLPAITPQVCPAASQQQWMVSWRGQQTRMMVIAHCEQTPEGGRWQWLLLNQLGQRIATAYNNGGQVNIDYSVPHPVKALVPKLVEAWQFIQFDIATLEAQSAQGWSFVERGGKRQIRFSGILRAEISYPVGSAGSSPIVYTASEFNVAIRRHEL
ncbi:DUF3261 domain-containing protein [Marinagarivorans cellulosilyticus]|uniref:DUF3261 domain-containing protein n=1 Tax=Marinagarivorans cellulosilyticus TaxID=2721545 RepID=UPI001F36D637|nr:DUF3261 domain-containing protein [Marinagarivorans cellulosilyticus]